MAGRDKGAKDEPTDNQRERERERESENEQQRQQFNWKNGMLGMYVYAQEPPQSLAHLTKGIYLPLLVTQNLHSIDVESLAQLIKESHKATREKARVQRLVNRSVQQTSISLSTYPIPSSIACITTPLHFLLPAAWHGPGCWAQAEHVVDSASQ